MRKLVSLAVIAALVLPVLPAVASDDFLEIHWDAGFEPPQETYFGAAATVYLKAGRAGYTAGGCTADLRNKRSGEVYTIGLVDFDSTANYTGSFIPDALFTDIEHGDQIEIKVYLQTEEIACRTIYIDDLSPTITTAGTITLTSDIGGDGVASVGDTITYAAGTEGTNDAVTWTVDLSAYGLSATATPGAYTLGVESYDGTFSATETVTDKTRNTVTGSVTVIGNFSIDLIKPEIVVPGTISLTDDVDENGVIDIGDEITYAAGTLASSDSDTWTVDLSAWGLSATADPDEYIIVADNATAGFVETVTDNGGNVVTGLVSTTSSLSNFYVWPAESHLGDIQSVHFVIENTGGFAGSFPVKLYVDGVLKDEQTVTLAAGFTQPMVMPFQIDTVGTHTVTVNGVSGSLSVLAPLVPETTPPATPVIPSPPEPELPEVPETPETPAAEPTEGEGAEQPAEGETPQQPAQPESVNFFLVFIGALAQSLVVYYIVNVLRKRAQHRGTTVGTTREA